MSIARPSRLHLAVVGAVVLVLGTSVLGAPVAAADVPTNEVTVVRVAAGGGTTDATTIQTLVDRVNGPVHDFWAEQTGGVVRFHATGWTDWVTTTAPCSDQTAMWSEAAAAVGFQPGAGKHLLLYVSSAGLPASPCDRGAGSVGTGIGSGGMAYTRGASMKELAHELGHNLGLGDSSYEYCDRGFERGTCQVVPQRDYYDVMGDPLHSGPGSLSAPQAARLGVLPADQQVSFTAGGRGGRITLVPMSSPSGVRAARLVAENGDVYWLEYRTAAGRDGYLGSLGGSNNPDYLPTGVLIRKAATGSSTSLVIPGVYVQLPAGLDVTHWTPFAGDAIPVGGGDFTVTVEEQTYDSVTLRIVVAPTTAFPRDWTGDGYSDLIAADAGGTLYVYPGTAQSGFKPRQVIGRGWQNRDLITMTGDWTGDGRPDLITRNPATGELWLYAGTGTGGFLNWRVIGRGWQVMDALLSPGDWDGDGLVDLLARKRSDGRLFLYSGDGHGGFLRGGVHIGSGWQVMTALVATGGDLDVDGLPDFVARRSDGTPFLYSGDGSGGFTGSSAFGSEWNIFTALTGPGDWGSDGSADLIVRRADGSLWQFVNDGFGWFWSSRKIGSGWSGYRLAS